jgi:putative spermidine/putrescine transport system ATP-binding protein
VKICRAVTNIVTTISSHEVMKAKTAHALSLRGLTKRYQGTVAIDDLTLDVAAGEFLTLLGPSGSGKTTVLMAIAGFVQPTSGEILLDGRPITRLPPEAREFGVVFQGYALFPHMTVAENVAYPLKVRRVASAERASRVRETLDLVQLGHLSDRRPAQLSGGQQQRVALARALVFRPNLLLLDEPLSALDKSLRTELQIELKRLHGRIGTTFVNVTHDQEEAITMSDRIAIMRGGRLMQMGSPAELFERPRSRFVAGFLGRSNFLEARVTATGNAVALECLGAPLHQALAPGWSPVVGEVVVLALRPNKIMVLGAGEEAPNVVTGRITTALYAGTVLQLVVETPVHPALEVSLAIRGAEGLPAEGDVLRLGWGLSAAVPVAPDAD